MKCLGRGWRRWRIEDTHEVRVRPGFELGEGQRDSVDACQLKRMHQEACALGSRVLRSLTDPVGGEAPRELTQPELHRVPRRKGKSQRVVVC